MGVKVTGLFGDPSAASSVMGIQEAVRSWRLLSPHLLAQPSTSWGCNSELKEVREGDSM